MTKLLEQVVSKVRQLPDAGQDFLAHLILAEIEAKKNQFAKKSNSHQLSHRKDPSVSSTEN